MSFSIFTGLCSHTTRRVYTIAISCPFVVTAILTPALDNHDSTLHSLHLPFLGTLLLGRCLVLSLGVWGTRRGLCSLANGVQLLCEPSFRFTLAVSHSSVWGRVLLYLGHMTGWEGWRTRASPSQWATATQPPHPRATPRSTSPPSGHRALTGWRCGPPAQGARCRFPRCRGWARGASLSGPHPLCTGQATLV